MGLRRGWLAAAGAVLVVAIVGCAEAPTTQPLSQQDEYSRLGLRVAASARPRFTESLNPRVHNYVATETQTGTATTLQVMFLSYQVRDPKEYLVTLIRAIAEKEGYAFDPLDHRQDGNQYSAATVGKGNRGVFISLRYTFIQGEDRVIGWLASGGTADQSVRLRQELEARVGLQPCRRLVVGDRMNCA